MLVLIYKWIKFHSTEAWKVEYISCLTIEEYHL